MEALAKGVIWEGREAVDNLRFLNEERLVFEIVEYTDPEWSVEKLHLIEDDLEPERVQEIQEGADLTPEEAELFYACEFEGYETASLYRIDGPDGQVAWAVMIRDCSSMEAFDFEARGPLESREEAITWAGDHARRWKRWSTDLEAEQRQEDLTSAFTAAIGSEPTEPYC